MERYGIYYCHLVSSTLHTFSKFTHAVCTRGSRFLCCSTVCAHIPTYLPLSFRLPGEFPVSRRWDLNLELSLQTLGSITTCFPHRVTCSYLFSLTPERHGKDRFRLTVWPDIQGWSQSGGHGTSVSPSSVQIPERDQACLSRSPLHPQHSSS